MACADYALVESQARLLGEALTANASSGFTVHGLFGIFANGEKDTKGRKSLDYGQVKTRFMHSQICRMAERHPIQTVCEIGFNAGQSAVLFLESAPNAKVISFDIGWIPGEAHEIPWTRQAAAWINGTYGARFELVLGDSAVTIPRYQREHPDWRCDVVFVDGSKSFRGRLADVTNMQPVSRHRTRLFYDEVTQQRCVDGSVDPASEEWKGCKQLNPGYEPATRAYTTAARSGTVEVLECDWTRGRFNGTDGICMARFGRNATKTLN
eukprot:6245300-Prymnesium_polylepis.2